MADLPTSPDSEDLTNVDQRFNEAKERLKAALGTSFVAVGEALLEMQKVARTCDKTEAGRQKWEDLTHCKTFEEYVRLEFQLAGRTARQYMAGIRVYRCLEDGGAQAPLPVGEKQCRWLTIAQHHGKPLLSTPKQLVKVWSEILDRYEKYRAEKAKEGKKVSPHPPATFILKHLSKNGFLAGCKEAEFIIKPNDSRAVARATRHLSGWVGMLEDKKLVESEDRFVEVAQKEKWNASDRKQLASQLAEAREHIDRMLQWLGRLDI